MRIKRGRSFVSGLQDAKFDPFRRFRLLEVLAKANPSLRNRESRSPAEVDGRATGSDP